MHYGAIKDFLNMKRSLNLLYYALRVQKNYFGAGRGMCTHQAHFWKNPFPEKIGIFVKKSAWDRAEKMRFFGKF